MRLLERKPDGHLVSRECTGKDVPAYAILSHTWLTNNNEEVSFQDVEAGLGKRKAGWKKIQFCVDKAAADGLQYIWIDTCCIDRKNAVELQEAINSMFRWYQNAAKCYVYLLDVSTTERKLSDQLSDYSWESAFRESRWFKRGWTLQELLAPMTVEFFSQDCKRLGDKRTLERQIHDVTEIPILALRGKPLSEFDVGERFSWAQNRQTAREEDKAYSMLGIFDIQMPLLYGEGEVKALKRLRKEIGLEIDLADRLPYASEAPFNSYTKQYEPNCLPDTRVDLLQKIYKWADKQDERCLFWLNGLAGTGKSTIARTVARNYSEQKRLGASFFFSRGGGDVGYAGKFVTSIAWQLAISIPSLHQHLCDALIESPDIANRLLREQWHRLVLDPLSKLDRAGCHLPYVLVVDALDERDDENDIRILLSLLTEIRSPTRVRLRVFLTSRSEIPIRHGFRKILDEEHEDLVLHNISPSIIDQDITIFLEHKLRFIGSEQFLDADWPGPVIIQRLVRSANGLFIWAATACRFVQEGPFAEERVKTLLEGGESATTPEVHLNELYTTVLKKSIRPGYSVREKNVVYGMQRQILGSIAVLFSLVSASSLCMLLNITKQKMDQILNDLHAILDIPNVDAKPLRLHHPSFRDFLLNNERCKDLNFWVDEKRAHQILADNCIRLISTLPKQDICGLEAPGMLATDVKKSQIEQHLPPGVQYACLSWIQHLQKSGVQLQDDDQVHRFLQEHFLHWLEALGWIGKVPEGVHALTLLESLASFMDSPRLSNFIYDAKRFVLYNRQAIEKAPLQIYCSALIFAPDESLIKKQFKDYIPGWIRILTKVDKHWNTVLQTFEGCSGRANISFSPDGKTLASASEDETIKLWDTGSGGVLQTLESHSSFISALSFSPDGETLAVSGDKMVKLWDTASGVVLHTLEGHSENVTAVSFFPDSKMLASASCDKTVKLWDVRSGEVLQTLNHSSSVYAVSFSPDGKLLASASLIDKTVKVWDIRFGAVLQTLESHFPGVNYVSFSPDGKILASAGSSEVKLYNTGSWTVLQTLEGHSIRVGAVSFSPDGKMLASASYDKTIKLWDTGSGALLRTLKGHSSIAHAVSFSPDGKLLASASYDKTVKLWDTGLVAVLQTPESYSEGAFAICLSPDAKVLASAEDESIRLWDTGSGAVLQTLECCTEDISNIFFSPDSKLLASVGYDIVKLWDTRSGMLLHTLLHRLEVKWSGILGASFSADSRTLASWLKTIKLWDTRSGTLLRTLEGHSVSVYALSFSISFSIDGRTLASVSEDETVKLWDTKSGAILQTLSHANALNVVSFSPDNKTLASASWDETVKLWDASSGALLQTLKGHLDGIIAVSYSPDGGMLASASEDETIMLWDVGSGILLYTLEAAVETLSFSDNGTILQTNRGALFIGSLFASETTLRESTLPLVFVDEQWVRSGEDNILWLPSEHRSMRVAVHGNTVCLISSNDRVLIMEFTFESFLNRLRRE